MHSIAIVVAGLALGQAASIEPEHAANAVYQQLLTTRSSFDGTTVRWPEPILRDGMSADDQRAAIRKIVDNDREVDDLLRQSVTAPQIVRVRDEPRTGNTIVRTASVWFVVYAELDKVDPQKLAEDAARSEPVDVANMRFQTHVLSADELQISGVSPPGEHEWYVHTSSRLLGRIAVESTDRTVFSQSAESLVVASTTARPFDKSQRWPNSWWPYTLRGDQEQPGQSQVYAGSAGYTKISKLKLKPGALLVESHLAYAEPLAWFQGAPILRSKIPLVAQDQIRRLRRELAKRK